jgi:hypothetical protein
MIINLYVAVTLVVGGQTVLTDRLTYTDGSFASEKACLAQFEHDVPTLRGLLDQIIPGAEVVLKPECLDETPTTPEDRAADLLRDTFRSMRRAGGFGTLAR